MSAIEIIVELAPELYTDIELSELMDSSEIITRCRDCASYHCDLVEWCGKFRHRTNANAHCAWPNDKEVR